ncbi:MAG: SdpI/YfhL protein family, partial [Bacteroidota bacterium]
MIIVAPALLLITATIFCLFPPRRINYWYGYRTSYSMQNQEIWDYANKTAANYFFLFSLILLFIDLILMLLINDDELGLIISLFA